MDEGKFISASIALFIVFIAVVGLIGAINNLKRK